MHCSMWFLYGEPLTVVTVHFSGVHTYTSILVNVMLSIRFGCVLCLDTVTELLKR